jgi:hypothetical protein
MLGVVVVGEGADALARGSITTRPWREWTTHAFTVEAGQRVAAGIDGEATELETPLRFHSRPGVLLVRIARAHPGASPSAIVPDGVWAAVRALFAIAAGKTPGVPAARPDANPV